SARSTPPEIVPTEARVATTLVAELPEEPTVTPELSLLPALVPPGPLLPILRPEPETSTYESVPLPLPGLVDVLPAPRGLPEHADEFSPPPLESAAPASEVSDAGRVASVEASAPEGGAEPFVDPLSEPEIPAPENEEPFPLSEAPSDPASAPEPVPPLEEPVTASEERTSPTPVAEPEGGFAPDPAPELPPEPESPIASFSPPSEGAPGAEGASPSEIPPSTPEEMPPPVAPADSTILGESGSSAGELVPENSWPEETGSGVGNSAASGISPSTVGEPGLDHPIVADVEPPSEPTPNTGEAPADDVVSSDPASEGTHGSPEPLAPSHEPVEPEPVTEVLGAAATEISDDSSPPPEQSVPTGPSIPEELLPPTETVEPPRSEGEPSEPTAPGSSTTPEIPYGLPDSTESAPSPSETPLSHPEPTIPPSPSTDAPVEPIPPAFSDVPAEPGVPSSVPAEPSVPEPTPPLTEPAVPVPELAPDLSTVSPTPPTVPPPELAGTLPTAAPIPVVAPPPPPPPPPPCGVEVDFSSALFMALQPFLDATAAGHKGIAFVRELPERIRVHIGPRPVEVYWLTNLDRPRTVRPSDLPALVQRVHSALDEDGVTAIFLEGIEYLVGVHGVERVSDFLREIDADARHQVARIWVHITPSLLSEADLDRLLAAIAGPSASSVP
ncbi:MAG: DUF835 domain-containing protein, partial [Thermoplasmata archaeon]